LITGGFLFLAAVYAIQRPSLIFLPPLVIVPLLILSIIFNPLPLWLTLVMVTAALLMTVVPGGLFGVLWRRMSKEKEKGRGRIMGIFFGFLFLLLSSPVLIATSIVADPVAFLSSFAGVVGTSAAFIGSLLFFLGVSGRLDRWLYDRRH
jgi:Na+/proline symporter